MLPPTKSSNTSADDFLSVVRLTATQMDGVVVLTTSSIAFVVRLTTTHWMFVVRLTATHWMFVVSDATKGRHIVARLKTKPGAVPIADK